VLTFYGHIGLFHWSFGCCKILCHPYPKTMEAYQLWWNKGTFWEMLKYHNSLNQSFDNQELLQGGGLDFESHQYLITFKWAQVKLAWEFLCIMNVIQQSKTLHNDLSQNNIMLQFPLDNLLTIYIGVCDWGEARRLGEDKPSPYGFVTKEETTTQR
jgi:hypothetical protein